MDTNRTEKRKKFAEHDEQVEIILLEIIKDLSKKETTAENAQALAVVTEALLNIQEKLVGHINISEKFTPEDKNGVSSPGVNQIFPH